MADHAPIKVLYILNTTELGGGNLSFINMIQYLHQRNVRIFIAYPGRELNKQFYERTKDYVESYHHAFMQPQIIDQTKETIKRKAKNILLKNFRANSLFLKKEIKEIDGIIKKTNPDIVHTNVGVIHGGYFAAKKNHIPHVWHIREYQTLDFGWEIYPSKDYFETLLNDGYVITITKEIFNYFHLQGNKKATCIYNGCFSREDVAGNYPKGKYFLCCSRISTEKGIDEAIKAFSIFYHSKAQNSGYKLVIAGNGDNEYINELKSIAEEKGCAEAVEFAGFRQDVRPLLDNATALIVASRYEGFGRMTAEAAFRGCIVAGKDTGGTGEILRQTGGFLYSGNETELANALSEISELTETEYIDRMNKAREAAKNLFSNEQYGEKILRIYQDASDRTEKG